MPLAWTSFVDAPFYRVLQVAQASFTIQNFAKQNFQLYKKPERPVILENVIYGWPPRHLWSPQAEAHTQVPPVIENYVFSNI